MTPIRRELEEMNLPLNWSGHEGVDVFGVRGWVLAGMQPEQIGELIQVGCKQLESRDV